MGWEFNTGHGQGISRLLLMWPWWQKALDKSPTGCVGWPSFNIGQHKFDEVTERVLGFNIVLSLMKTPNSATALMMGIIMHALTDCAMINLRLAVFFSLYWNWIIMIGALCSTWESLTYMWVATILLGGNRAVLWFNPWSDITGVMTGVMFHHNHWL